MKTELVSPSRRRAGTLEAFLLLAASRRSFLRRALLGSAALFTVPGAFAEELVRTARLTEGPFYPDKLPLDTDNDLLIINDKITPAVGEVTHLTGRVLNPGGEPARNTLVEIWQCDNNGAYIHSGSVNRDKRDGNFQGYGRFLTDSKGQYYFRTIKPVAYPGRTPHIHVAVSRGSQRVLTTQMLIKGHPQNTRDGVFNEVRDAKLRETILVDFKPIADSKTGELAANFDIVIGLTPEDASSGERRGPPRRRP
jgi:protocatechuate 3,4-dioxygenase beta subunit